MTPRSALRRSVSGTCIARSDPGTLLTPGIFAGQQGIPRWGAGGSRTVQVGETDTLAGQHLQMGCTDGFGPVAAQVSVTNVIGIDVDEVGLAGRWLRSTLPGQKAGWQGSQEGQEWLEGFHNFNLLERAI